MEIHSRYTHLDCRAAGAMALRLRVARAFRCGARAAIRVPRTRGYATQRIRFVEGITINRRRKLHGKTKK
jgi:hypothetical protein